MTQPSDVKREPREARNARVLALHLEGVPNTVIAERMGLSAHRVSKILTASKEPGEVGR